MRLVIESPDDRDHVDTHWAQIRQALPGRLFVVDGDLVATFKPLTASDQTPAPAAPLHPAGGPPETATLLIPPETPAA